MQRVLNPMGKIRNGHYYYAYYSRVFFFFVSAHHSDFLYPEKYGKEVSLYQLLRRRAE